MQAAAGDREPGRPLGQGIREKGDREERPEKKMNPRAFPTGRASQGAEESEVIDMSLDGPDPPEEAGSNARSPSPNPDYDPGGEAEMMLDEAKADQIKVDSPEYVAPGSRSPSEERSTSRPNMTPYYGQVCAPGNNPQVTPVPIARR